MNQQYLLWRVCFARRSSSGFTLMELLVVTMIIGILAAISVPAFLNQAAKARQSEAKQFIGAVNRAQQSYIVEHLGFAASIETLGLIGNSSAFYSYSFVITTDQAAVVATPVNQKTEKAYTGATSSFLNSTGKTSIICESPTPGSATSLLPVWDGTNTSLICPTPMKEI